MIKTNDWTGKEKIDAEINRIKNFQIENFTTPCSIFMSFECEEGVNRALQFNKTVLANEEVSHLNLWLDKFTIDIQRASEPTDIIWENRQYTYKQRLFKGIFVTIFLVFLLACSFLMILLCSQSSQRLLNKFPSSIDCELVTSGKSNDDLEASAIIEYTSLHAAEEKGQSVSYKGHVQCFCDIMYSDENKADDAEYGEDDLRICKDYQHSKFTTLFATNGITVIIVVINQILTKVSISLITWIGYDTHSEMLTKITNGVFIAQFFNTAILILLVYGNLDEVNTQAGQLLDG